MSSQVSAVSGETLRQIQGHPTNFASSLWDWREFGGAYPGPQFACPGLSSLAPYGSRDGPESVSSPWIGEAGGRLTQSRSLKRALGAFSATLLASSLCFREEAVTHQHDDPEGDSGEEEA